MDRAAAAMWSGAVIWPGATYVKAAGRLPERPLSVTVMSSRAERLTSFDVADFALPTGREEEWRFSPVRGLANAGTLDLPALAALARSVAPELRVLSGIARADRWPELRPAAVENVLLGRRVEDPLRLERRGVVMRVQGRFEQRRRLAFDGQLDVEPRPADLLDQVLQPGESWQRGERGAVGAGADRSAAGLRAVCADRPGVSAERFSAGCASATQSGNVTICEMLDGRTATGSWYNWRVESLNVYDGFTSQPQRWAVVPAVVMATTGAGLLAVTPGDATLTAAGWVWPPAAFAGKPRPEQFGLRRSRFWPPARC